MFENILVANDGSEGGLKAFDAAVELASRLHANLHMVSVEEDLPRHALTIDEVEEEKETADSYYGQLGDQCRRRAALHGITLTYSIIAGHEVKAIIDFARQGRFNLLVVGFTGHSRIYDQIWGGTSQNLPRFAPCSVLIVK
jgi:nucleotide-binding universal stress UspA family protein